MFSLQLCDLDFHLSQGFRPVLVVLLETLLADNTSLLLKLLEVFGLLFSLVLQVAQLQLDRLKLVVQLFKFLLLLIVLLEEPLVFLSRVRQVDHCECDLALQL